MVEKSLVEVNHEATEPHEYFKLIKDVVHVNVDKDKLESQLKIIAKQIIDAKAVGQTDLVNRLAKMYDVITKEQILFTSEFNKFCYAEDVEKFANHKTIQMIEIGRYKRTIPSEVHDKIKKAKQLNVFDEFYVIFTNLTNEKMTTPADKAYVARNRDPIIFGVFTNQKIDFTHDRMYFIADWEDVYCNLTLPKMIEQMAKQGITNALYEIDTDDKYLMEIVRSTLDDMKSARTAFTTDGSFPNNLTSAASMESKVENNATVWQRMKARFKNAISGK